MSPNQRLLFIFVVSVLIALLGYGYLIKANTATELRVDLRDIKINPSTGNREHQGAPFSGLAVVHFEDGRLASEQSFTSGRRDGQLRKWFSSGQLAFESHYRLGRREGLTQSWWRNGNRRSTTQYLNDKPDGENWRWYQTGEKFKRLSYAAGIPVGLQQGWRRNGKLFSNFEYRNGRTYGLRNSNLCVELDDEEISIEG